MIRSRLASYDGGFPKKGYWPAETVFFMMAPAMVLRSVYGGFLGERKPPAGAVGVRVSILTRFCILK